jgi:small subunit ribosomal protein S21
MLIIPVKDGEAIDRALKKYKRKFDKTGVVRALRGRQQFVKPSVIKRQAKLRAAHKQRNLSREEQA